MRCATAARPSSSRSRDRPTPIPPSSRERFAEAHEARYGYRDPDGVVELVNIRAGDGRAGPRASPLGGRDPGTCASRSAGRASAASGIETRVLRGEPPAGLRASGPAIFELPEATLVLPPGWGAEVDDAGTIVATSNDSNERPSD